MRHCKILNFLFEAVPVKPWQDFLLRRHMERCPVCGAHLAGREEARRVLAREEDFRGAANLWPGIKSGLADPAAAPRSAGRPRMVLVTSAAAASALLLAAVLSVWLFRGFRAERPMPTPPAEDRFEMNYVRIGGQPADSYIYQPRDSGMTLIWAEKKIKGGLS